MSSNGFYSNLLKTIKETAENCKIYRDRCNEIEYDFDTSLNKNNLGEIPYIPWHFFKLSNDKFKELLRGDTFDKLEYWLESSSTTGDPSIVGRLDNDLQVLKANYNDVFNTFSVKDHVNNLILFAPKLYMINSIKHKFYNKNSYLLYKNIVDIWKGKHISFLLQFFLGHTLKNFFKTGKLRAAIGISGKDLKAELNRVAKNKIPTIMANSPLWMHRILKDYYQKEKRTFDLSEHFNIITGGGGWDGTKGRVKIGYEVEKPEFIEQICDMFNITPDKFCDNFAATESPLACGGHWSKNHNDFLLHVDKNKGRIVIRDIDTLEPIKKTGEPGILELITPYGVDSYAGVAVLLDDLAQVENWNKCPVCGKEGTIFRIIGRITPSIGKGCSSLFNSGAFKL